MPAAARRHLWVPSLQSWHTLILASGGAALLPLALGQPALALAVAAGFAFLATGLVRPDWYRAAAGIAACSLPLLWAWPLIQPQEHNATAYVALFAAAVVLVGLLGERTLPATLGAAYVSYIAAAALSVVLLFPSRPVRLGELDTLLLAASAYFIVLRSPRAVRRCWLAALLAVAAVEAALGLAQVLAGWPVFDAVLPELFRSDRNYFAYILPWVSPEVVQASGTFAHFNGLGALLALTAPVAFGLWSARLRSAPRLLLFLLLGSGVAVTFSRGALLGTLVGVGLALSAGGRHSRRTVAVLLASAGGIAFLLGLSTVTQYYQATQNVDVRAQTWSYAARVAASRPASLAFGHGYRYFHTEVLAAGAASDDATPGVTAYMSSLHSGPLQLVLEFGVAGATLFVVWLVSVYRRGLGMRRTPLTVALLAGATGFLCHQAVDTSFFAFPGALFVAVLALAEAETVSVTAPVDPATGMPR